MTKREDKTWIPPADFMPGQASQVRDDGHLSPFLIPRRHSGENRNPEEKTSIPAQAPNDGHLSSFSFPAVIPVKTGIQKKKPRFQLKPRMTGT